LAPRPSSDRSRAGTTKSDGRRRTVAGIALVRQHAGHRADLTGDNDASACVRHLSVRAIASAPEDPESYAVLADLWMEQRADLAEILQSENSLNVVLAQSYIGFLENNMDDAALAAGGAAGARPTVGWATAPWFSDPRFLGAVSADADCLVDRRP
jgi:hypothetical protein